MLSTKKFLIIDDSDIAISIMRTTLHRANVRNSNIDSTINSHKAIRLLTKHKYDVVLCDYNMGNHIDGALIFDEIKQRKLISSDAIFICITGDNTLKAVTHLIELEPDDYLLKPYSYFEFIERIENVIIRKNVLSPLLFAMDNKDYQAALDLCDRYRNSSPQYLNYLNRIYGDCLLNLKRHQEARLFYEDACKHTDHVWPNIGFGQALQELGEYTKAEDIFRDILVQYPTQPVARRSLAKGMMMRNQNSEALEQFNILHKINPANPLRELIIANLHAALREYDKAAFSYQLFITKVIGTNRYSNSVSVNISISLLLASLYTDDKRKREKLINEARYEINELKLRMENEQINPTEELSLLAGFGVLACMSGDFKRCFIIANKIKRECLPIKDFYTALNIAQLYAFCGMPDLYEKSILQAKQLCGETEDGVLLQSQIKLLKGCQEEIRQRLNEGKKFTVSALEHSQNNYADKAINDAYNAFFRAPFSFKLCFLILELMIVDESPPLNLVENKSIIESCYWVYCNDNRPSKAEKNKADELFNLAMEKGFCRRV
ncbi:response regulator [Photobacterium profundum]|uniref:Response regulatory domain-containing protein n=1 Tax=Photobacterium profundum (strain SS9) TaxID=298386 RepID=Q6LJK1_PHOPR|nr:response regulator [Photobacterium profundum]CAG22529.1 hypothetical protein PBPRB0656 [Photobacterium profundum SS9]